MTPPKVFLDANVLYPGLVRGILLCVAKAGLLRPHWSQRVLDEWQISIARKQGPDAEMGVIAARQAMAATFPDAMLSLDPALEESIHLPDRADAHVAAAANGTDILLTFNLRDFPRRRVQQLGYQVSHPDSFLWHLLSTQPEATGAAIERALLDADVDLGDARQALKRAQLPRVAKLWVADHQ